MTDIRVQLRNLADAATSLLNDGRMVRDGAPSGENISDALIGDIQRIANGNEAREIAAFIKERG